MRTLTAFSFYAFALGTSVAMVNGSIDYSMKFGGIALISYLGFTLINSTEQ